MFVSWLIAHVLHEAYSTEAHSSLCTRFGRVIGAGLSVRTARASVTLEARAVEPG